MEEFRQMFSAGNIIDACLFIAKPLAVLLIFKIIINIFTKLADGVLNKSKLNKSIHSFVKSAIKIIAWTIAFIIAADMLGLDTSSLVTLFGVVSLALSLAFQNIMTNIFSGVTILWSNPFSVGDYVEIDGIGGTVQDIKLMRTTLITPDKKRVLISNSDVCAGRITNYSIEPIRRVDIKVSVSYDAPTEVVKEAVMEVLLADERIKNEENMLPTVRLSAYNSNDIEYTIRAWVDNGEYWNVYFDVLENIRDSFANHNVQFSYPHIVVHNDK